jgi:hypothetical protein
MNLSVTRSLLTFSILLGCAAGLVSAADPISVSSRVTRPPEMGEVTWCDVRTKLGTFGFIPPAGWALQPKTAAGSVHLESPDCLTYIDIEFGLTRPAPANTNRIEVWRQTLGQIYDGASVVEDFPCHTSAYPGHAFDLVWSPGKDVQMASRTVMLSCPQGSIRLSLAAHPDKIRDAHHLFGALLTSFSRITSLPPKAAENAASTSGNVANPPKT